MAPRMRATWYHPYQSCPYSTSTTGVTGNQVMARSKHRGAEPEGNKQRQRQQRLDGPTHS